MLAVADASNWRRPAPLFAPAPAHSGADTESPTQECGAEAPEASRAPSEKPQSESLHRSEAPRTAPRTAFGRRAVPERGSSGKSPGRNYAQEPAQTRYFGRWTPIGVRVLIFLGRPRLHPSSTAERPLTPFILRDPHHPLRTQPRSGHAGQALKRPNTWHMDYLGPQLEY